jgi:hypothetical protein
MKYHIAGFLLLFALTTPIFGNSEIDSLLQELDQTIAQSDVYEDSMDV